MILEPSIVLPPSVVTNSDSLGGNLVENSSVSVVVLGSAVVDVDDNAVVVVEVVVVVVEVVVVVVEVVVVVDLLKIFFVVASEIRPSSIPTSLSPTLTPKISRISLISGTSSAAVMFIFSSSALSQTTLVTPM